MPANKYTKSLYKSGTVKSERMADMLRERAKSPMPKEGTTNPSGGRPAAKNLGDISNKDRRMLTSAAAKIKPTAAPKDLGTLNNKNLGAISNKDRRMLTSAAAKIKPARTIRTTVLMKPTPTKKK
jgi:hypothetical protein